MLMDFCSSINSFIVCRHCLTLIVEQKQLAERGSVHSENGFPWITSKVVYQQIIYSFREYESTRIANISTHTSICLNLSSHTQSLLFGTAVDPGFETSLRIHLIVTKHFLISHEALQYRRNSHVVDAHEHTGDEPCNGCDEEERTDDTVQLVPHIVINCEIAHSCCEGGDENFSYKDDSSRNIC